MQCSVYIAISLDGFIARSDGGIDWLARVERPGEDYGYQRFHDSMAVRRQALPRAHALRALGLFGTTGRDIPLQLVAARPFASGLVQLEHRS